MNPIEKPPTSPRISRRRFLRATGTTLSAVGTGLGVAATPANAGPAGSGEHQPFRHGVASGDPTATSVILWTRVTPTPEATPGSGLGPDTPVIWELSGSPDFTEPLRRGHATSSAASDHTLHIDPGGLHPATTYFFRFRTPAGHISPVGRTATTHLPGTQLDTLRLAVASCANWEAGYFAAYGDIARRAHAGELDVLVFLGDYIYEFASGRYAGKHGVVRPHQPPEETITLDQYRIRYGHYRSDPQLQAAHAALPWIAIWDDHESADNAWRDGAPGHTPAHGSFADRKRAATRALLEWLPIRSTTGSPQMYRTFIFGDLATLSILDLRSFREAPPQPVNWIQGDRSRSMMGAEQFAWLQQQIHATTTHWSVIGSSVMMAPSRLGGELIAQLPDPVPANLDQWDGYALERDRLFDLLADNGPPALVLSGDIHSEWGNSLRVGDREFGVELVCSSVTAANVDDLLQLPEDNQISVQAEQLIRRHTDHVRHVDLDAHGYATAVLDAAGVEVAWCRVADLGHPDSPVAEHVRLHWSPEHGFTQ